MHPYRDMPAEPPNELLQDGTRVAFAVLAVTGIVAMIALPLTYEGAFGGLCGFIATDWLVRHRKAPTPSEPRAWARASGSRRRPR